MIFFLKVAEWKKIDEIGSFASLICSSKSRVLLRNVVCIASKEEKKKQIDALGRSISGCVTATA